MAIIVSMVISGIAVFMIWLHSTQLNFAEKNFREIHLRENIKSGFLLAETQNLVMDITAPPLTATLFNSTNDSIQYKRIIWGAFYLTSCRASYKEQNYSEAALQGILVNKDAFALYLADHKRPLSICGKAVLSGKCFLPPSGLKTTYVDRILFSGQGPADNDIRVSREQLPPVNKQIEETNLFILQSVLEEKGQIMEQTASYTPKGQGDSLFRSFSQSTWFYKLPDNSSLSNISIKGNIALVSTGTVIINENTKLEDILIYARKIIIKSGFRGSFQGFASDSILVESHVKLDYPSTLMLLSFEQRNSVPAIAMGNYVKLDGLLYANHFFNSKAPFIVLEKKSTIRGLVYLNGYLTHRANIVGTLMCDVFMLRQSSGTYENYLMDGEVNSSNIPSFFVNSPICQLSDSIKVVKWLN